MSGQTRYSAEFARIGLAARSNCDERCRAFVGSRFVSNTMLRYKLFDLLYTSRSSKVWIIHISYQQKIFTSHFPFLNSHFSRQVIHTNDINFDCVRASVQ